MKKILYVMALGLLLLACSISQEASEVVLNTGTMVAETFQAMTQGAQSPPLTPAIELPSSPQPVGNEVSYANVSFILPPEVAANALAGTVPAVTGDDPGWGVAPEYIKFELDGYFPDKTFHVPQILIYPAPEYAAVNEGASASISALQNILNGSAAPIAQNLPTVPSFNAGKLFAAQIQVINFKSGSGVRFLTEYGQYYATANNVDLFYQFQGLTSDGRYYIIAILPVTHPLLAIDENPETLPPPGGIPFPGYDDENAINTYYTGVVNLLNSAALDVFQPSILNVDTLIQSMEIN